MALTSIPRSIVKYAITFLIYALALGASAVSWRGAFWLLLVPATALVLLGAGYAGAGAGVFGKRRDGTRAFWSQAVMAPYTIPAWIVWYLHCLTSEDCCNEIVDGVLLGRRPKPGEIPNRVTLVVDLTAEFEASFAAIGDRELRCLPTLDADVPDDADFISLLEEVEAWDEPVYIHCAAGHGRSATLVAAMLVNRGLAEDAASANAFIRARRPGARLKGPQPRLVDRVCLGSSRWP